ncbi:hypothetical protein EDC01DRAFT_745730 [Geopyxis carbonaria]|nr:hypothetical protein EDC01DRAFT_745730 [Geopyxis carbonaria]
MSSTPPPTSAASAAAAGDKKVWFITGASTGLGAAIARHALAAGDAVIATSRSSTSLAPLTALGATPLTLDITAPAPVLAAAVASVIAIHGRIDILLNNAGYILQGAVEECSAAEIAAQFAVNVFAQAAVARAVLPYMRAQRSGVVAGMGSVGAWQSVPGTAFYCASKATLVGVYEALRGEVAGFGIGVTVVEPGYFRSGFLSGGHRVKAEGSGMEAYRPVLDGVGEMLDAYDGKQPGDVEKGARMVVEVLAGRGRARGRGLPLRLCMGSDAVRMVGEAIERQRRELEEWREMAGETDHDDVVKAE